MTAQNQAVFEEGTEIRVDTEVEAPATGWTLNVAHVARVGSLVALHIEATNQANAAATVCRLQADFAPAAAITDASGNFSVGTDGTVSFNGSRTAGATHVLDVNYLAGQVSP